MNLVCVTVASPNAQKAGDLIDKDIENDTSGDFKRLLVSAAQVYIFNLHFT